MQHSHHDSSSRDAVSRVVAILTTFNRRPLTIACLDRLTAAAACAKADLSIIVVDDASTDGTAAAIRQRFAQAQVVDGGGDLFWNRGMHAGMALAMMRDADYLLWLNDDTMLQPDAVSRLLRESVQLRMRCGRDVLLAGATCDPQGRVTYGGGISGGGLRRFQYRRVWDAAEPVECDVINGNCVLIPAALARTVGNLDPGFEHAMGDTDYALRAKSAGFPVYVASGFVGECHINPTTGTYRDATIPMRERWRMLTSRKGLPPKSYAHFARRHGGSLWSLYFAWPYVRFLATAWLPRRIR